MKVAKGKGITSMELKNSRAVLRTACIPTVHTLEKLSPLQGRNFLALQLQRIGSLSLAYQALTFGVSG